MKKILGYGALYLVGFMCVFAMMHRVDSLDNKKVNNTNQNNLYSLNDINN